MTLQIRGLTKRFDGITAVRDLNLELITGKITALIGPNGAGKTTLFNLITGFLSPTQGEILLDGRDISGRPSYAIARKGISRTFQEVKLFRSLSVMDNLLIAKRRGNCEGLLEALFRRRKIDKAVNADRSGIIPRLAALGLSEKMDAPAEELSYGQSKLVEITRAMATEPDILLLDEPVAGLNPLMIETIRSLLKQYTDEMQKTLFIIEHNMPFVFNFADWVVVMDHGEKIAEGPPETIRNDSRVIEAYLG
jgi:branched-chain amino acid transport system ATP-binding protein